MAKGYSARGGFSGGGSAMRQQQMQQKLLKMQQDMAAAQEAVENASFTASVGGGVVQATVSGKKELTALTVKPEAVDPEDVEMLQDLVISAVNEALRQSANLANRYSNLLMPINANIGWLSYALVAIVGAVLGINGLAGVTLGTVITFVGLNKSFTNPISQVSMQVNFVVTAAAGAQQRRASGNIFDLRDSDFSHDFFLLSL